MCNNMKRPELSISRKLRSFDFAANISPPSDRTGDSSFGGDGGRIKEVSESVELAESLDAFCHNALDSVLNGDDAVDKTDALTDADVSLVAHIAVLEEHLANLAAVDVRLNLCKGLAFLLAGNDALGHCGLVGAGGVFVAAEHEDGVHLGSGGRDLLLDAVENRALLGQQEAGTHVHALCAEHQSCCHLGGRC